MNTLNALNTKINAPAYNPNEKENTMQLNTIYSYETDVSNLENSNTFTFSQNVRGKFKTENDGFRIVIEKPSFLTAESLQGIEANLYKYGAEELLKQVIRKYLKDNAITANTGASLPEITLAMLEEYLESTGTKLLTKDSILAEVENNIAETLVTILIEKGVSEAKLPAAIQAFAEIIARLASPAYKVKEALKLKVLPILEASAQTPVVVALINRINKKDKEEESLLDML